MKFPSVKKRAASVDLNHNPPSSKLWFDDRGPDERTWERIKAGKDVQKASVDIENKGGDAWELWKVYDKII